MLLGGYGDACIPRSILELLSALSPLALVDVGAFHMAE
jgi:hypothetical protein